jgi:NifB/MoaA-like Fe-S oxidoreductase
MDKLGTGFFQSVDGAPALGYRAPRGGETTPRHGDDVLVVTGEYAAPILRAMFDEHGFADVRILAVENRFFGGNIKVAGLLTGQDVINALVEVPAETVVLVPDVCLSEGRFLDGLGLEDLPRPVMIVATTGQDLRATLSEVRNNALVRS